MGTGTNQSLFVPIYRAIMTWLNGLSDDIFGLAIDILPVALPVLGIAIAVFFGVKFIKKVMR